MRGIRILIGVAAVLMAQGCGVSDDEAAALAKRLDWTTSYAHALLRAGVDRTAVGEDEIDRALMRELRGLNEADAALPAKVEEFERARVNGGRDEHARRAVVDALDVIGARYSAVVRTMQPRKTHQAVHRALAETPALVAELRERVGSRVD